MATYGSKTFSILARYMLCALLCSVFSAVVGCSGAGQSIDVLFTAANSRLSSAQEAGAAEYAKPEFEEAGNLLARAEIALKNKDKGARSLIGKAHAKARLAEALARQSKAETEAAQLEADLEKALAEANRVSEERQSSESELAARSVNNE